MEQFIITIDSSCDISNSFCKENKIYPLYMKYTIEKDVYTDTMEETDINKFYEKMEKGAVPKTTQINTDEFIRFFEPLLIYNKPIIHLSISSGLSGTYANALRAVKILKEKNSKADIRIIDTLMTSGGNALLLLDLIKIRNAEKSIDEGEQYIESNKKMLNTFYTTPEMTYLYRGGRVKRITAMVAGLLRMNPILKVNLSGELVVHQTVPGEKKAIKRVVELVEKNIIKEKNEQIIISHSNAKERAEKLGEELIKNSGIKNIIYTQIGTTIGAHTGPGLIAVFFYGKERKV